MRRKKRVEVDLERFLDQLGLEDTSDLKLLRAYTKRGSPTNYTVLYKNISIGTWSGADQETLFVRETLQRWKALERTIDQLPEELRKLLTVRISDPNFTHMAVIIEPGRAFLRLHSDCRQKSSCHIYCASLMTEDYDQIKGTFMSLSTSMQAAVEVIRSLDSFRKNDKNTMMSGMKGVCNADCI